MVRRTLLLLCMGTALVMLTACEREEAKEQMDAVTEITEAIETEITETVETAEEKTGDIVETAKEKADPAINDAQDKATEKMENAEEEEATETKGDVKKQIEGC